MQVSKVQGKGNCTIFTVSSKFGTGAPHVVTLTLGSWTNGFYDKHVLREGESSQQTYRERKGLMDSGAFNATLAKSALDKGIFSGANRSTFIRLKKIDLKQMVFCLAKAMVENHRAGAWVGGVNSYVAHLPIEAVFDPPQSVCSYDTAGAKTYSRSIKIGGRLQAAAGANLAFDLDHCGGSGAV